MATELYNANQATTTVSSGGTTAPAGGTQETWTVASSAMFGAASTGVSQFHVADAASGKGTEIIAVTNVSGTTWTVTRGAESTTPVTHTAGFTIYQVVTAGWLSTLGSGGGGTVTSVTPADTSIVVSGSPSVTPAIATGTLDVIAAQHPPAANWSNNSHKITALANGTVSSDAAAFGQIPTALPPNGSAGGDLGSTYPNPTVTATHLASALPIAQGGTGQATAPNALSALGGAAVAGDIGGTSASPQVTATHLASALPIVQGGTGQASAANALNALGGAAVAGDIGGTSASPQVTGTHLASALPIAQGGTSAATQQTAIDALAGAVTSGNYLRGNGTHVTLAAIQAGDVPGFDGVTVTGTPSTGQIPTATGTSAATWQTPGLPVVTFTYGSTGAVPASGTWTAGATAVDQDSIVRVCTVSGTPGTWARDGALPWQFWVDDYGALGNGKITGDAAMTTGTATLTSATASFAAGDVGKNIVVNGALGTSNAPLYTTILSVTNSTTIVLNANATNTVSSAAAFYASDDSATIKSAITAASAYAQAGNWKAQVLFRSASYGLATLTTTAAGGALAQQNALVPLPYPNVNGTTQKLMFELVGVGQSADEQYFDATIPSMTGTCLVATVAASGTRPGVVAGPNASTNLSGTWANTKATIRGITVWCGWNPGWTAFDLRECAAVWVESAGAQVLAPNVAGQLPLLNQIPSNTNGAGFNFPSNNDNGAGSLICEGYYTGVNVAPRTTIEKLMTFSNTNAAFLKTVDATVVHGAWIGYWSCQSCTTAIVSTGNSGTMPLVIDLYDGTSSVTNTIADPNGTIQGTVNWWNTTTTSPVVGAGVVIKFVNLRVSPGPMSSPPSAPGSGSPSTAIYRDAHITLSVTGGSLTALTIGGVDQHIPAGCVLFSFTLPSGYTFTPTYTGTLANDVTVI